MGNRARPTSVRPQVLPPAPCGPPSTMRWVPAQTKHHYPLALGRVKRDCGLSWGSGARNGEKHSDLVAREPSLGVPGSTSFHGADGVDRGILGVRTGSWFTPVKGQ